MADVELVIKIPKEYYELVLERCKDPVLLNAFKNGTQLPKRHGDLVDIGQCDRKLFYQQCGGSKSLITAETAFNMLESLPTIIEVDKESEEK